MVLPGQRLGSGQRLAEACREFLAADADKANDTRLVKAFFALTSECIKILFDMMPDLVMAGIVKDHSDDDQQRPSRTTAARSQHRTQPHD